MKRKSPVSGVDMEFFFGKPLRGKARISHQRRTCRFEDEDEDDDEEEDEDGRGDEDEDDHSDGDEDDDDEYGWEYEWEEMTTPMEALTRRPRKTPVGGDLGLPLELLETILSYLPTLDLIVATGVNMTFRNLVQNSPTLQSKLFLRPTNKPREFVKLQDDCKVAVAAQKDFDHGFLPYNKDDPAQQDLTYEIAALCPLLIPQADYESDGESAYGGSRVVCLSRLAPLAEHWANMYLTNPPSTEVRFDLTYHGGYARQYSVAERYNVSCETGVTLASLLDVIYLKGDIVVEREPGWWPHRYLGDMAGHKTDTTISQVIAELEGWWRGQEWGCMMGKMELDLSRTTIEIPDLVFREWDTGSDDCYFRFTDCIREYRTTAMEGVTDTEKPSTLEGLPQ
jgi:hypothetical protein